MLKKYFYKNGVFIEVSLESALKSFIVSYKEDYETLPNVELLQKTFHISKLDAEMTLYFYK